MYRVIKCLIFRRLNVLMDRCHLRVSFASTGVWLPGLSRTRTLAKDAGEIQDGERINTANLRDT